MSLRLDEVLPAGWLDLFATDAPRIGIGLDLATTTGEKSNPSALAVTQEVGLRKLVRTLVRYKTSDPEVTEGLLVRVLEALAGRGLSVRRLCIDATNERFFAVTLKKRLAGKVPVELVISSEKTLYLGEPMLVKAYLGNLLVHTLDDGYLALPPVEWVKTDIRQVVRDRGSFATEVAEDGGHGDCFDAIKLSLHALKSKGGKVEAKAVGPGTLGLRDEAERKVANPYAHRFSRGRAARIAS